MDNTLVIKGVQARLRPDGTVELNLEHVARGLGFVQKQNKNGKIYESVRWERIADYFAEFNFPPQVGENGFSTQVPKDDLPELQHADTTFYGDGIV